MPARRALLLVNRKSRNGNAELDHALQLLSDNDIQLIPQFPDTEPALAQCIHDYAGQIDCVILGGGDGTMNAGISALMTHRLPFGILPMGTANDLARTLGIPGDLVEAAAVIVQGTQRSIDIGWVNGVYFFNVANIGLGVQVKHELTAESKQRWGILAYARGVFAAFQKNRSFSARIICDGKHYKVRSIQIAVGNGRYYGGGMAVAENATIDDHLLSLYSIAPMSLRSLVLLMPKLRRGQFDTVDAALSLAGKHITIETRRLMPVSMDGEVRITTPAHFKLLPKALDVYAPEPSLTAKEINDVNQRRQASCVG
jgi:diacylglycerol kinase (ATP)